MSVGIAEEVEDLTGRINRALIILHEEDAKVSDARLEFKALALEDARAEWLRLINEDPNLGAGLLNDYAVFLEGKMKQFKESNIGAYGGYGLVRDYIRAYGV